MYNKENLNKFLDELSELSNKYGYKICGCGCCGSPWIEEINGTGMFDDLMFKDNKYEIDN